MADKKDTIGGLSEATEKLNADNAKTGFQSMQILQSIDTSAKDILADTGQMVDLLDAIRDRLAPDAFGAAQATENAREGGGTPPPAVIPAAGAEKGGGMSPWALLGAGLLGGLLGALTGLLDFDAEKVKQKVKTLVSIADEVDAVDTAETVATLATLGAALAIFGGGSAIVGLGTALANFTDPNWADNIVNNVVTLVGMADKINGFDTVETVATLTALGGGLAIFGIGSAVAGLSSALTNFTDPTWAQTIVDNVATLLSIADLSFGDAAKVTATLGVLGAGLAIFGVGSAVAGLSSALTDFTKADWAKNIVDNVTELLKIGELSLWDAVKFVPLMTAIAAGLAVFSAGSAVAGLSDGLTNFLNPDWAKSIVANVTELLKISKIDGIGMDTAKLVAVMTGIGAALAVFAVGQAAAGVAQFVTKEGWVDQIVTDVKKLIGILDNDGINEERAITLSKVFGHISAGLLKFTGAKFIDSLAGAGAGLLNFLSGNESPVEQMMRIADNSEKLEKGANSLERIRSALAGLSDLKFDGSNLNLEDMAEDLMKSVPVLESAIMGGKIKGGIFPWSDDDVEFKGLASGDIKYEEAIKRIAELRQSLGFNTGTSNAPGSAQAAATPPSSSADFDAPEVSEMRDLTLPYDHEEGFMRANLLARAMGLGAASKYTTNGTVPVTIDDVPVPSWLLTDDEIDNINAARSIRASMNRETPDLIPTRRTGQNLQEAQGEMDALERAMDRGNQNNAIVNNIAPNTVNNATTTNIAARNQHHKMSDTELMALAY